MEIFILNDKFEVLAEIDSYTSLIWCRRAHDIGALDLEIEASAENVEKFQIGYFIYRKDTNDICRIDSIEVKTDAENGDQLIIGAVDLKSLAEQVTVLGEYKTEITNDGESTIIVKNEVNVEEWIREAMKVFTSNDSTVLPKSVYPQFQIDNFPLYNLKGYSTKCVLLEEKDAKLSEHINYLCKMSGMSWSITYDYDTGLLKLDVAKGLDKTVNQEDNTRVLFSKTFDNLQSTKIAQSIGKMANVAVVHHNNASIVGDNGVVFAYLTREEPYGIYRFDISVDGTKIDIPHIQTDADFIQVETGTGDYKLQDGKYVKGKGDYLYQPIYTVDEIKSYKEILRGLGLAKLRENRVSQNFESEINFNQFVYREDYDVGDIVTVQNDYGIQLDAKIIEVVETWDETGYSIEPAFEFIGAGGNFGGFGGFGNFENTENDWDLTDCLITEKGEPMMTETENFYLMYEAAVTTLATEYGVALTSEEDALITTVSSIEPTAQVASMATYGAEAVAATTYDVSPAETVDIETVKISELPEAEGIGDACCLPIVQDGETKKIYFDKIRNTVEYDDTELRNLIEDKIGNIAGYDDTALRNLINQKTNFARTTMKQLGFSGDITLVDLWKKLRSTYGTNGMIEFQWDDSQKAIVYDNSGNSIYASGGLLIFSCSDFKAYGYFNALWLGTNTSSIYELDCTCGATTDNANISSSIYRILQRKDLETLNSNINTLSGRITDNDDDIYKLQTGKTSKIKTTMKTLGFSGTVDGVDFWKKLYSTYGENAVINFDWIGAEAANVKIEGSTFTISGGLLIYNCSSFRNYGYFSGIYISGSEWRKYYIFNMYTAANTTTVYSGCKSLNTSSDFSKTSTNVMGSDGSIDFNTNKATIQLPIYSADTTNQPTAQGAMWLQEVKESE